MSKLKKVSIIISSLIILLIVLGIIYFNTYHYFSPIYKPCNKEIKIGMDFETTKNIMSKFDKKDEYTIKVNNNKLFYGDEIGVFCSVKFKDSKVDNIIFGRDSM